MTDEPASIDYRAVLADLEEKLANIESEKLLIEAKEASLKDSIASVTRFFALESGESMPSSQDIVIPKRAFKGMAMIQAIKKYLAMAKTGQTSRQIIDALRAGGFETHSKFFKDTVRTSLRRHGPPQGVVKRGDLWWLGEWAYTPKEEPVVVTAEEIEAGMVSSSETA